MSSNDVRVQGDRSGQSIQTTIVNDARCRGDRGIGKDVSKKIGVGAERGRRSNLPVNIASLGATDQNDRGSRRSGECRTELEDKESICVASSIKSQSPCQLTAAGELVDTALQSHATEVLACQISVGHHAGQ